MPFENLFQPASVRPRTQSASRKAAFHALLRDQASLTTWLSLGAFLQSLAVLALGRISLLPAFVFLVIKAIDSWLQATGVIKNTYMEGVLRKKFSPQFPNDKGEYNKPADQQVCIFLLGFRSNHPLGIFAPHVKTIGSYANRMYKELDARAEEFGFLGMSGFLGGGDRVSKNEIMNVLYFKDIDGAQRYAHSPLHKETWAWWNKHFNQLGHITINHEGFVSPKGGWEAVYGNSPLTGLGATSWPIRSKNPDGESETVKWYSPACDASRGPLRSTKGRMNRSDGNDHDAMEPIFSMPPYPMAPSEKKSGTITP